MFRKYRLQDRNCHRISPIFILSLLTVWKPSSISKPCYPSDTQRRARNARGVCVAVQTYSRLKPPWRGGCEECSIPSLLYWRYQIQLFRSTLLPVTWTTICSPFLTQWSLFRTVQIRLVLLPDAGWQHTRPLSALTGMNGIMVPKFRLKGSIDLNQRCKGFDKPKRSVWRQDDGHCQGLLLPLMFLIYWCFCLPRLSGEILQVCPRSLSQSWIRRPWLV